MSESGHIPFGRSAFVRWLLSPFVLILIVFMPAAVEKWTPSAVAVMVLLELLFVSVLAGFWLPKRLAHWAFRAFGGLVFIGYAAYLVHELLFAGKPLRALVGFVVIGGPSLLFAIRGRFTFHAEPEPEELAADRQAYEQRILRPDWFFYERHLQRPAPQALRELYADRALVTEGIIQYDKATIIGSFEALDEAALLDTVEGVEHDVAAIATSDSGDLIYLRPGRGEPDTVYITSHDGGGTEVLAESVEQMVAQLRRVMRKG